jgi:hypothetical protein
MLDHQTGVNGHVECAPPLMVKDEAVFGTGQLPKFAEDLFRTTDGRWLIPTAEVSLTNAVREQILPATALPLRLTALTPCFRSEAGSAGRDTRGYIRQHQFDKVELVTICAPEESAAEHERMTAAGIGASGAGPALSQDAAVRRATWALPRGSPTTSKSGCPDRAPIARSRRARTAAISRRGG